MYFSAGFELVCCEIMVYGAEIGALSQYMFVPLISLDDHHIK